MRVSAVLCRKEFRANVLIYLFPFPFWLALALARAGGYVTPAWFIPMITYAVPFTLAVAYGLQAFDVEEDAQTKDFLQVKPLSTWRIVLTKFWVGLLPLLLWVVLFLLSGNPSIMTLPRSGDIPGWAGGLLLAGVILAFVAGLLAGLLVRGPRKLLIAPVMGFAFLSLCFFPWSSWVAFLAQLPFAVERPYIINACFYLAAILLFLAVLGLLLELAVWTLRGRPRLREERLLPVLLAYVACLALCLACPNLLFPPPLRAVNLRGLELFGLDRPYWTVEGAWRPRHAQIAVACPGNVLGLARPGRKPIPIYRGKPGKGAVLSDLAWSPDGGYIAFVENGRVCVMRPGDKKVYPLGKGMLPCWSARGDALVFTEEIAPPRTIKTESGASLQHTMEMRFVDLNRGLISTLAKVSSLGTRLFWDSSRGNIMTADFQGRLVILGAKESMILVPPDAAGSGVFWEGFYPLPGNGASFALAVMNISDAANKRNTARIYRYDTDGNRLVLLDKLTDLEEGANLILNPATGVCLIGKDGVYRSRRIQGLD